eukprot:m.185872 g.185872  ORF g.185872 m.185872 type:complete len:53 (+) comp16916_c1_seq3:72-230(+)
MATFFTSRNEDVFAPRTTARLLETTPVVNKLLLDCELTCQVDEDLTRCFFDR